MPTLLHRLASTLELSVWTRKRQVHVFVLFLFFNDCYETKLKVIHVFTPSRAPPCHEIPGNSISGSPELTSPERTTDGSRHNLWAKAKAKATRTTPRREERPHCYTKFQTRAALHHRARNGTGLYN